MTAHIIYQNYLSEDGRSITVGGIQTYITNLSRLLQEKGYKVVIYQQTKACSFKSEYNNCLVYGIHNIEKQISIFSGLAIKQLTETFNPKQDILIWGSDNQIIRTDFRSIAIQHGISWDVPECKTNDISFFRRFVSKYLRSWEIIKRIRYVDSLVCVDHNFVNWYRALVPYPQVNLITIPNFTNIPLLTSLNKENDIVKIIFARRFVQIRGTRIFTNAVERLIEKYSNIDVTIAGSGPDEEFMKSRLQKYHNVHFIKYDSQESQMIHSDKHIAVIPTIGSEGTSLSLLEAMACKCAVVCTDVGGMTDIVLDHYNGLMITATEDAIYNAISELVEDNDLRERIADKAYETVKSCFSKEMWENHWSNVIDDFSKFKE